MITHNQCLSQEQILVPLRQLYKCDFEHRKIIADYANNFKVKGFFLRKEIDFFQERLAVNKIDFDVHLLPSKLLTVELVPSTCWFSNVRENVSRKTWDFLRKSTYKKANHKCEVCGGRGDKWPVECHEIWDYDDIKLIQKLSNLTALCPDCHRVKHIGLAHIQGFGEQAEAHLAKINNWNIEQKDDYLETLKFAPLKSTALKFAPLKSALPKSAQAKFALLKFAPIKSAPLRDLLLKLEPSRFASWKLISSQ